MAKVINFPLRQSTPEVGSHEALSIHVAERLATLRASAGGDARRDDRWAGRIASALAQFFGIPAMTRALTLPAGLTASQREEVLALLQSVAQDQFRRDAAHACLVVRDAMVGLALDATGAQLPPGYPPVTPRD
jgi:hypothetical protein